MMRALGLMLIYAYFPLGALEVEEFKLPQESLLSITV
jgi:hypothetical protein